MKLTTTVATIVAVLAACSNPTDARFQGRRMYADDTPSHRRLGYWSGGQYTPRYDELFGGPLHSPSYDEDADDYHFDRHAMRRLGSFCNGAKCFYTNPALKRECDYGYAGTYWSHYSKSQCI